MKNKLILALITIALVALYGEDHGIYNQVVKNCKNDFATVEVELRGGLQDSEFNLLESFSIATPDLVREDKEDRAGYKATLFILGSDEYVKMLTSYGNKYLTAGFFRVGLYEDPRGIQITITDPETINRIVFNDLDDDPYLEVLKKTFPIKARLIKTIHDLNLGENVEIAMEPLRDTEDLRDASKDMFMMVGPMTFFLDEEQFPVIYETGVKDGKAAIKSFYEKVQANVQNFTPSEEDIDYSWSANGQEDLKWRITGSLFPPDSMAVLLGLTRPRTEALSQHIAGKSRSEDDDLAPGMDHITAFPVEVLMIVEDGKFKIMTQREMFRMDMYFWDAGKMAFMTYRNMPGVLDNSIKRALVGGK